ncbi:MAG TPA: AAA family ATPase [Candidatus Binataceae bacterium]|nr:AAA family ATPase [Candidatus Binataceae bacterium]
MHCSKCGSENPVENNFCVRCGNSLIRRCSKCGTENSPTSNFCGKCGAALSEVAGPAVAAIPPVQTPEIGGERRHLTILFCDLVGSVTLTAQLDPEEWRATVAGYQRAAAEAITRFGGEVVRYVGDGIMAFFGYPVAHDNDAERAARAGLAILEAIAQLNEQPAHVKLAVRIGIDSGRVVVGAGTGNAVDAFGDTANIAARVQAAAEPDTVVVTGETHRLISGLFVVEDRGAQTLKGIERPVQLYRVVRPSGMQGRFKAAAAAGGLTPFVGRDDELRTLLSRWARAAEGEGQVVTIIGEPGIGKSRLVQEFRERIAADRHTWLEGSTAAFFQNTPFYATAEMLRDSFHWRSNQNNERRLAALEASLKATGVEIEGAVPLIASLLELPFGDKYPPLSMPPDQQRKRLLATLVAWTMGAAKAQPLVIATEDLHWADPSTLEVTQLLVEQGATAPLMLIYTARPEFRAPWSMRAHHTQLTLNRLGARDIRTIVAQVAASKALSAETVAAVVERTGGVPLFVEELTRALLESGGGDAIRQIPATLHDSLMARLDRLGPAKEVAQVGAVLGREFSYELLHAVHRVPEPELQAALGELAEAELLYVQGLAPNANYRFKHALIRDAAYEALLKSRRKELHLSVARTIDEQFPVIKESHPEVLARHWTEAGETDPAIAAWKKAGERAVERRAYREAEQHYREALALLNTLPESGERDSRELTLQLALGNVMVGTRGWTAADTGEAYARARILAERSDGTESLQVFTGLWSSANLRGELRSALALADQMFAIARNIENPAALAAARSAQGYSHYLLGDLVGARQYLFEAIEYRRSGSQSGTNSPRPGGDPLLFAGQNEWQLGYADHALGHMERALLQTRTANNPFALGFTLWFVASLHSLRGEFKRAREANDESLRFGAASGFPLLKTLGKVLDAWVRAQMGETSGTVDQIREGLAELDAMKFYATRAKYLGYLCEAQALAGVIDDALLTAEQALQVNPDELIYRSETLRLRGELRLRRGDAEKAVSDFRAAIAQAQTTSAKAWELRATMSLGRLLKSQGRRSEARAMLAEIYNWFTEGFDTLDLKEAKALLDTLQ